MGKKAKTSSGKIKARERKIDKASLPPPPPPLVEELGSAKLLDQPAHPGNNSKALDHEGFDDGGVADLSLLIDLEDNVLRRKRGDNEYFQALKADLLPRVTKGQLSTLSRRDQKVRLARLLFSEEEHEEDKNPSEVYVDLVDGEEDEATMSRRTERLSGARAALRLSTVLREPACASLSLSEISKRRLALFGKKGADSALRCAEKALEIAGDGFYDSEEVRIEAEEDPVIDPKYEKNATYHGLAHPSSLKLLPVRVSYLCLRSAYLHRGNALAALGREDEARASYEMVFPMLEKEPRCGRLDWERHSLYVNIGNTYSRQGDYEKANENFSIAEQLGRDHIEHEEPAYSTDGYGMVIVAMRAKAFASKKAGQEEEGKKILKEVIAMQIRLDIELEKKAEEEKKKAQEQAEAEAAAAAVANGSQTDPVDQPTITA